MNKEKSPIEWEKVKSTIEQLLVQEAWRDAAMIACAAFSGLRGNDWLDLRWSQVLSFSAEKIKEKKTDQHRLVFRKNEFFEKTLTACYEGMKRPHQSHYIFRSKTNRGVSGHLTLRGANDRIAAIFPDEKCRASTHSLRKSFGRKLYDYLVDTEGMAPHLALFKVQAEFKHKNPLTTMTYIGYGPAMTDTAISNF